MNRELKRFINTFRELEQQDMPLSASEQAHWDQLKQKLSGSRTDHPFTGGNRSIAVVSLYSRAGASFVAGNFAWSRAGRGGLVTLSEMPGAPPYFVFALDLENRESSRIQRTSFSGDTAQYHLLHGGTLLVRAEAPGSEVGPVSHAEIATWFLKHSKESSLFLIDLSSHWREEPAAWIADWSDEIWLVTDSDWAALTRALLAEDVAMWWEKRADKIRIIANKSTPSMEKPALLKKLTATLSLYSIGQASRGVDAVVSAMDPDQVTRARLAGKLYAEMYPDSCRWFERLCEGGDV